MKRLAAFLLLVLLVAAEPATAQLVNTSPPSGELRGLWVDAFHDGFKTRAQVDELVSWARRANANALFVQVRRRGDAYYARSIEPRTEDPDFEANFDALQYLIERAHSSSQPLQVHAWLATLAIWHRRDEPPISPLHVFNRHGLSPADEDTWLMLRDDGEAWAGEDASGTYYLDPGHPDAARWTVDTYLHVLKNYDVDGIHMDHVRYFEGRGQDRRWGYNPRSVARFNASLGREPGTLPEPSDHEWMAWRRDQVTALVRRVYLEAKAAKPRAVVSGAVIAWGKGPESLVEWERSAPFSAVFQDWRYWLEEGLVDVAIPMDYYREPTQGVWLDQWVAFQVSQRGRRTLAVGLGGYLNDAAGLSSQMLRVRRAAVVGTVLYSYAVPVGTVSGTGQTTSELGLRMLREHWTAVAPPPDLPWLTRPVWGHLLVDVPGREGVLVVFRGPFGERSARTDGTGMAALLEVPPGRYSASVLGHGIDPSPFDMEVVPGRTTVTRFILAGS